MASSPMFKVYSGDEYVASVKYAEHAAAIVALEGDYGTIRYGHSKRMILWREGLEAQPAGESYDFVAETVYERMAGIGLTRPTVGGVQ
jgi:hypothetical protein